MNITSTLVVASSGTTSLDSPFQILWGFVFVVIVLTILAWVTQCIGQVFVFIARAEAAKAPKPARSPVEAPPPATGDDDELVAVIAAAVHTCLDQPHRIVSIQPRDSDAWASEGRRQIFSSHKIR